MNMRQWARATYQKIADQPAEIHHKKVSMVDVEMILRQSIQVLTESLNNGEDLRLRNLGRLWVEQKAPHSLVSNLPHQRQQYDLKEKRALRFRASARLATIIKSSRAKQDAHTGEDQ